VRRDNPEIRAAAKRWEASQKRAIQAATPDKPRLDIERMYTPDSGSIFSDSEEKAISLTQEVPFPATLHLRRSAALQEAGVKEAEYRAKTLEILSMARQTYAGLFLAEKSLQVLEESIGIMRRFSRVAEAKVAAGKASQADALKAAVELTRMLNMRVALGSEVRSLQGSLNGLMGRPARSPLRPTEEPATRAAAGSGEELEARALAGRPEAAAAGLAAARSETGVSLATAEFLPDFMLQYRSRRDPVRGGTHDAVLGLSLPLWFWKPAAMLAEAKAEREMAKAELQAVRLDTQARTFAASNRVSATAKLLEAYRTTLLPQAEESLKVAETAYQADKAGFLDLLDSQRALLSFKLEYYQYAAEYETRAAELDRLLGREN
jgi:outer membrane protein TolC